MAALTVGTSAVKIPASGRQRAIIQNLGPGTIYLDGTSEVTTATGIKIPVEGAYESATGIGEMWVVSDSVGTNVRVISAGV